MRPAQGGPGKKPNTPKAEPRCWVNEKWGGGGAEGPQGTGSTDSDAPHTETLEMGTSEDGGVEPTQQSPAETWGDTADLGGS